MLEHFLKYRLDAIALCVALFGAIVIANIWLRRKHQRRMPRTAGVLLAILMLVGLVAPEITGQREHQKLQNMLSGIAPTYAQELELAGHATVTLDTPSDDPAYVAMIAAQSRWEKVNPNVADIYTFRKTSDGQLQLIVDAPTDYNRDGKIEGELEEQIPIGEIYEEATPKMFLAFEGQSQFDDEPETDPWGTWVSAYYPLRDRGGNVEAVLGVDYDARHWLTAIATSRAAALGFVAVLAVILLSSVILVQVTRAELQKREVAEREREKLQEQLLIASRSAGMAEVATNVLHNVGNVLNSVNVSAGLVTENLQKSKVAALSKAVAMIDDHRSDIGTFLANDAKGKLLPDYLVKLSQVLSSEHDSIQKELALLTRSVDHIKQIVASQQTFAKTIDESTTFNLTEVCEDAVRMNQLTLERHQVKLVSDFAGVGTIYADRHKLLQILTNLISNAKNAVKENPGERRIDFTARVDERPDGAMLAIAVRDTGVGISKENLTKIFTHGFTTRKEGHGFGLHSCAIAAQQMKGKLLVDSAGIGMGASFTVEIPMNRTDSKAAL